MVFLDRIDLLQFRVLPFISNCFSTKVSMVQLPMLVLDSYESKSNFFYVYESRQQFNCTIQVPRMNQHCQDTVRFLCWIVAYLPARQLKGFQTRSCGVWARPVAFALLGHLDMVPRQQWNCLVASLSAGKYMKSALGQMPFDYIFSETFRTFCGSPWVQCDKMKNLTHACIVAFSFEIFSTRAISLHWLYCQG